MAEHGHDPTYRFDGFVFEKSRSTLRGPDGVHLPLRPKAVTLLLHLLDNPGRLLHRSDLLDRLWPGVTVTDDSLTQCMSELRQVLGKRAAHVLRTVPRQGYMMEAAVERQGATATQASRSSELVSLRRAAIVLLPFEHPAADPLCQDLAASLAAELRAELATFEELRLVPVSHPTAYRVHGEVRPSSGGLRVLVSLQTADGTTLSADRFSVPRGGEAELDDLAIGQLAVGLARRVNREDLLGARDADPASLSARQLRLLGADHHQRATEEDTLLAWDLLERAVALDPGFALAYAWLSYAVQRAWTYGWGPVGADVARDRALVLAQQAVQIEPGSALCQSRLAWILLLHGRCHEAAATAHRAVAGQRNAPWEVWTTAAEVLALAGEPEEAVLLVRRALAQDPQCSPLTRAVLGRALLLAGHSGDAMLELQWCAGQLRHHHPTFDALVVAATEAGHPDVARDALSKLRQLPALIAPGVRWLLCRPADVERYQQAFAIAEQELRLSANPNFTTKSRTG